MNGLGTNQLQSRSGPPGSRGICGRIEIKKERKTGREKKNERREGRKREMSRKEGRKEGRKKEESKEKEEQDHLRRS